MAYGKALSTVFTAAIKAIEAPEFAATWHHAFPFVAAVTGGTAKWRLRSGYLAEKIPAGDLQQCWARGG